MLKDKKVLAGGAVLFVAAFWFYIKPNYFDSTPPPVYTDEQIAEAPRPTVTLESRVLNLKAPVDAPNYAKAVIAIEFADPDLDYIGLEGHAIELANEAFAEHLKPDVHRIWDAITLVFGEKTIAELATIEGKEALKEELIAAVNAELHHQQVENIYFVELVTQ